LRTSSIALTLMLCVIALAQPAGAHVTVDPSEAPAGAFVRLDLRVPTEGEGHATHQVQVQLPPGFAEVATEPVPGWTAKVKREKAAQPIEVEGEQVTEQVRRITFTAKDPAAKIRPDEFRDFGLALLLPDEAGTTLSFKAIQRYDDGDVVRWIGPPDADEPAPQLKLTSANGAQAATSAASGGDGTEDDDASKGLGIAALVLGGLGVIVGIAAFATRRRGIRTPPPP
jgi:periplasmic copper chaperone A